MTGGPRPNFLVVGAMKAGTSSLHAYLDQHPEVFVSQSPNKELHFFDRNRHWQRSHVEAYLENFCGAGDAAAVGESTPSYCFAPGAMQTIAEFDPAMRIIFMVRDPVARAISHVAHRGRISEWPTKDHLEVGGIWWELAEDLRTQHEWIGKPWLTGRRGYHARGHYHEQLRRIYANFPSNQVVVIRLEDFRADTQAELDRATDLLGVSRFRFSDLGQVNQWTYERPPNDVYEHLATYYLIHNRILHDDFGIRVDDWRHPVGVAVDQSPVLGLRDRPRRRKR